MYRRLLIPTLLVLVFTATALAERVELGDFGDGIQAVVEESSDTRIVVRFDVGAFTKEAIDINGNTYYQIRCDREGNLHNVGEPALPRICRSVVIPNDAHMRIEVLSADYVDFPNTPVEPSKGHLPRTVNPEDVPYTFGDVYQRSGLYPGELATLREPHILRDHRGTVIDLNAFQYDPGSQTLRVYRSVTVEITPDGPGQINVLVPRRFANRLVPDFAVIYRRHFINWEREDRYTPISEVGDLLIITYDDYHDEMMPFVEWKRQKGMRTTIVDISSIGNNSGNIAGFIQDLYDSTNLAYVLIVGDHAHVHTYNPGAGESDPCYGKVAGGDNYPDIFVGRFSAESPDHVVTQVERSVEYEKTPNVGAWLHMGTGIASNQGPGHHGEYDDDHADLIRDDLLAFTYTHVDQIYDPYATAAMVTAALNEGRSIVNYTGHGSTTSWGSSGFSNSHVNQLVNDNMLPFMISVACNNGTFTSTTCFGEAWLRATDNGNGEPTGAIGAYMSLISQSWDPPMDAQDEAVDLLVAMEKVTFGGICFNGSCLMIDINGGAGVNECDAWTIFGDPSLLLRTDIPAPLTVNHEAVILFNFTEFEIEVVGVERALCALYHEGTLYGSGYTGSDGMAVIPIGLELPIGAQLTLTVTSFNAEPYITPIQVITPDGPYVLYESNDINDAAGNNDGLINCGEEILLGVQLKNVGPDTAYDVQATLTTTDPYVTLTDDQQPFGDIAGQDGLGYEADAFAFMVAPDCPDGHVLSFDIAISGTNRDTWTGSFTLPVHSPVVGYVSYVVNDPLPDGNNNGILDPGETGVLIVTLENTGSAGAYSVAGELSEDDLYASITDSYGFFGGIASAGGLADNTLDVFEVSADAVCPQGHEVLFTIQIDGGGMYTTVVTFGLVVGDREVIFLDDFAVNQGWTGMGGSGEWTIGPCVGGSGSDGYGGPDPTEDHTPGTDNTVLGNDLTSGSGGDYSPYLSTTYWVTSPVLDCEDYMGVIVKFYRWLGVETAASDHARLQAFNGTSWVTVWENSNSLDDQQWTYQEYDLSSYADENTAFQIRFGIGSTSGYGNYCGWNIDDLVIRGYNQGTGTPAMVMHPTELTETVFQGESATDTIWVRNDGDGKLKISFRTETEWLEMYQGPNSIYPWDSLAFEVTYNTAGMECGDYDGLITYESNDPVNGSGIIPVSLSIPAPDIALSHSAVEATVPPGEQGTVPVTVNNYGPGPLHYTILCNMFDGKRGGDEDDGMATDATRTKPLGYYPPDPDKGGEAEPYFAPVSRGSGGPDAFGYRWIDSDEPGGPEFEWVDISGVGTEVVLEDDNFAGPFAIGFGFPFYDSVYSELYIGSNGYITFGSGSGSRSNKGFPEPLVPNNLIAMWWDDLDPEHSGQVLYHYDAANGRFILSFDGVPNYKSPDGTGSLTFQAILYTTGKIKMQYAVMEPGEDTEGLNSASIGIENQWGGDGLEVVYNAPYMHDNLAILFHAWRWLSVDPAGGTIQPYGNAIVNVNFDARDLAEGSYTGQLNLTCNDPDQPGMEVPVTLIVGGYLCGDIDNDGDGPNIQDLTYLTAYMFGGGPSPQIPSAANVDGVPPINIADLSYLVSYMFGDGPDLICGGM